MDRVGRRPTDPIKAATGERIVAFGRAGKPSENPFFRGISDMALVIDKKRAARKSVSQPGWITLEGGFAARQCVVHNMSVTGAKVTIEDSNSLPAKLRLAFSRDARTGRPCEVVWRRGKSVGVKFVR